MNYDQISFIPSGIVNPLTSMEGIHVVTPYIGYAVFEGDVVNVSHLELQFDFDVTSENKTMWPGEGVYVEYNSKKCIENTRVKKIGKWSEPPSRVNGLIYDRVRHCTYCNGICISSNITCACAQTFSNHPN